LDRNPTALSLRDMQSVPVLGERLKRARKIMVIGNEEIALDLT